MNLEHLRVVREALKDSKIVTAIYHDKPRKLEALGLIYGEKVYLVAREKAKGDGIYNYLLHKFEDMKLTEESFDKTLLNQSIEVTPEFVHYRKSMRTPVSLGLETQEEVDRKIKEYEKVLENVAKREREKERRIYGIFLRIGIAAAVIFLLIFNSFSVDVF